MLHAGTSTLVRYVGAGPRQVCWRSGRYAVALGRKNYVFAGSNAGVERAAAIYTLLGTANLNGIDPEAYLRYVLATIAEYPVNRVDELLPWNLAEQLRDATKIAT